MQPHNVEVEYAGRAYRVCFLGNQAGARCLGVFRRKAGGGESAIDIFDVTGRAVINSARGKVASDVVGGNR